MATQSFFSFFKPEVRKQGEDIFRKGAVFLQSSADTQVHAFVKSSSSIKVRLMSESIANTSFDVDCSCPSAKKGQFCKHIWATLLAVEQKNPDFLDSKTEIEKADLLTAVTRATTPANAAQAERKEMFKEKFKIQQADYRKAQYQKQKEKKHSEPELPEAIQSAFQFFAENGFSLSYPIQAEEVANARKTLARVFHPDKGGTHAEALELNRNYEILIEYSIAPRR
jgi:uncharacterized Zn finger protein